MTRLSSRYAIILGALALSVPPAAAADLGERIAGSHALGYEFRLGAFAHDPFSPEKGSVDINAEFLTPKLGTSADPLVNLLIPRFHVGGTGNFAGRTSHVYAGFTWTLPLGERWFVEASFGGAIHNGETGIVVPVNRNAMGCTAHFRESASLGYRFTANWSLMATIEHISNAGLCNQNRGLTNAGVRLGYQF